MLASESHWPVVPTRLEGALGPKRFDKLCWRRRPVEQLPPPSHSREIARSKKRKPRQARSDDRTVVTAQLLPCHARVIGGEQGRSLFRSKRQELQLEREASQRRRV